MRYFYIVIGIAVIFYLLYPLVFYVFDDEYRVFIIFILLPAVLTILYLFDKDYEKYVIGYLIFNLYRMRGAFYG